MLEVARAAAAICRRGVFGYPLFNRYPYWPAPNIDGGDDRVGYRVYHRDVAAIYINNVYAGTGGVDCHGSWGEPNTDGSDDCVRRRVYHRNVAATVASNIHARTEGVDCY